MNREKANKLINDWNGKDDYFLSDGELYGKQHINEAFEILYTKKSSYKIAFICVVGIIACIVTALIIN